MSQTIVTAGQSLIDVTIQELGSIEALFDLADAAGLAITDLLTPGQVLTVPDSAASVPSIVSYFSGRAQRINTGSPTPPTINIVTDFNSTDFLEPQDFA